MQFLIHSQHIFRENNYLGTEFWSKVPWRVGVLEFLAIKRCSHVVVINATLLSNHKECISDIFDYESNAYEEYLVDRIEKLYKLAYHYNYNNQRTDDTWEFSWGNKVMLKRNDIGDFDEALATIYMMLTRDQFETNPYTEPYVNQFK